MIADGSWCCTDIQMRSKSGQMESDVTEMKLLMGSKRGPGALRLRPRSGLLGQDQRAVEGN